MGLTNEQMSCFLSNSKSNLKKLLFYILKRTWLLQVFLFFKPLNSGGLLLWRVNTPNCPFLLAGLLKLRLFVCENHVLINIFFKAVSLTSHVSAGIKTSLEIDIGQQENCPEATNIKGLRNPNGFNKIIRSHSLSWGLDLSLLSFSVESTIEIMILKAIRAEKNFPEGMEVYVWWRGPGAGGGRGVSREGMPNRKFMIHLRDNQIQPVCPTAHAGVEGWLVTREMVWHFDKEEMKMESLSLMGTRLITFFIGKWPCS